MSNTLNTVPFISAMQARQLDANSIVLLDVRTASEFSSAHIPNSINIPLNELSKQNISTDKLIVLICQTGKRAENGAAVLRTKGLACKILAGGLLAWKNAGFVITKSRKHLSIEQQTQLTIGTGIMSGMLLGFTVNKYFFTLPLFFGLGLVYAGLSGSCTLAMILSKAPWNRSQDAVPHSDNSCLN